MTLRPTAVVDTHFRALLTGKLSFNNATSEYLQENGVSTLADLRNIPYNHYKIFARQLTNLLNFLM
jgi:hypothetical protein